MHSNHKQVFIVGHFDGLVASLFLRRGFKGTRDLTMADVVVFTGGADISPSLYNEGFHGTFSTNKVRDDLEVATFQSALNWEIPMIGICRGAQLLNVLNGGSLWQDVDNHTANHEVLDVRTEEIFTVTSTHHQQMRPNNKTATMIAVANTPKLGGRGSLSTRKRAQAGTFVPALGDVDPEVVWYERNKCLCFQPHPEYPGSTQTETYFWNLVDELFTFDEKKDVA